MLLAGVLASLGCSHNVLQYIYHGESGANLDQAPYSLLTVL